MCGAVSAQARDGEMSEQPDDLKEFLLVLRRALILIVHWINRKYDLP